MFLGNFSALYPMEAVKQEAPKTKHAPAVPFLYRFFNINPQLADLPEEIQQYIASFMPSNIFHPFVIKKRAREGGKGGTIYAISYSNDGTYILTRGSSHVIVWDPTGREVQKISLEAANPLDNAAIHPQTNMLVLTFASGLKFYQLGHEQEKKTLNTERFRRIIFSQSGTLYLFTYASTLLDMKLFQYDPITMRLEQIPLDAMILGLNKFMRAEGMKHPPHSSTSTINYTGTALIAASTDCTLYYNLNTADFHVIKHPSHTVTLSNDAKRAAFANLSGLFIYDFETKKIITCKGHKGRLNFASERQEQVNFVSYSTDSTLLLSGSDDKTARVWDAITGKCLAVLPHSDKVDVGTFNHSTNRVALNGGHDPFFHEYMIDFRGRLTDYLKRRITLEQLLFVAFLNLSKQLKRENSNVLDCLHLSKEELKELENVYYSFHEENVRRYLKCKYSLEWRVEKPESQKNTPAI